MARFMTRIDDGVKLITVPAANRPSVSRMALEEADAVLKTVMEAKGTLTGNALRLFSKLADAERKVYTLLPFNLALWLYELGNSSEESRDLYTRLSRSVRVAMRREQLDGGEDTPGAFSMDSLPITKTMKEYIQNAGRMFRESRNRQFAQLQGLISGLTCAVRGRVVDPGTQVYTAINNAMPEYAQTLGKVPVGGEERLLYSNAYTENDRNWNVMLFQVVEMEVAVLLVNALLHRANAEFARNGGRERTKGFTREELIGRLYKYMRLSKSANAGWCRDFSCLCGVRAVWVS